MSLIEGNPLVTIAIPAYKGRYLYNAIESVLNQSYKNIELIVVDDCSPENLKEIVFSFKDDRIKYYRNKENLGRLNPVNNWNLCLSYAKGVFFALLCDDDVYEPSFVEEMLALAYKYPNSNVFRARASIVDCNDCIIDYYPSSPEFETCFDYVWHVAHQLRRQTVSEFMYRIERMKQCNGYHSFPYAWYSDYFSVFDFSLNGGICSTTRNLVKFRMSGINITSLGGSKIFYLLVAINEFEKETYVFIKDNFPGGERFLLDGIRKRIYEDKMGLLVVTNWNYFFKSFFYKRKYKLPLKMFFRVFYIRISRRINGIR